MLIAQSENRDFTLVVLLLVIFGVITGVGLLIEINSANGSPGATGREWRHHSRSRVRIAGDGKEKRVEAGPGKKAKVLWTLEGSRPGAFFGCRACIKIRRSVFSGIVDADPTYRPDVPGECAV